MDTQVVISLFVNINKALDYFGAPMEWVFSFSKNEFDDIKKNLPPELLVEKEEEAYIFIHGRKFKLNIFQHLESPKRETEYAYPYIDLTKPEPPIVKR